MAKGLSQKMNSLSGYTFGCPVCGGHALKQKLQKRQRSREDRMWRREEVMA